MPKEIFVPHRRWIHGDPMDIRRRSPFAFFSEEASLQWSRRLRTAEKNPAQLADGSLWRTKDEIAAVKKAAGIDPQEGRKHSVLKTLQPWQTRCGPENKLEEDSEK
jgi:hypothetical protein